MLACLTLKHLLDGRGELPVARSALNHFDLLQRRKLRDRKITIMTPAPEGNCFRKEGILYIYGDLHDDLHRAPACCGYDSSAQHHARALPNRSRLRRPDGNRESRLGQ